MRKQRQLYPSHQLQDVFWHLASSKQRVVDAQPLPVVDLCLLLLAAGSLGHLVEEVHGSGSLLAEERGLVVDAEILAIPIEVSRGSWPVIPRLLGR